MNILIVVGAIMLMHLMSFVYDYADQIADGTVIKGLLMKKSKKNSDGIVETLKIDNITSKIDKSVVDLDSILQGI